LVNLKPNGKPIFTKDAGKISDYTYEIDIQIYGRKTEDADGDNRSVNVNAKLLKSNATIGYEWSKKVDGKNEKHAFDVYPVIYKAITENKLPFLLVKINYLLAGRSDNYELIQTIAGGPNDGDISGDFTFRKQSDISFTRFYIAFIEQDKPIPVLIPLGLDHTGKAYFDNICKKLSVSLKNTNGFVSTDRYVLNLESTTLCNPRLTIYNVGSFNNLIYNS
jgi:hypothetical protein